MEFVPSEEEYEKWSKIGNKELSQEEVNSLLDLEPDCESFPKEFNSKEEWEEYLKKEEEKDIEKIDRLFNNEKSYIPFSHNELMSTDKDPYEIIHDSKISDFKNCENVKTWVCDRPIEFNKYIKKEDIEMSKLKEEYYKRNILGTWNTSKVKLVNKPKVIIQDSLDVDLENIIKIFLGYKQCYCKTSIIDLAEKYTKNNIMRDDKLREEVFSYIERMSSSGHTSPLEHAQLTFLVEDVSLSMTHQCVRHRISSYSQKSLRCTDGASSTKTVLDDEVLNYNKNNNNRVLNYIEEGLRLYEDMVEHGVKKENARNILVTGTSTSIVISKNFRDLSNFFSERSCSRAQKEIRMVSHEMEKAFIKRYPMLKNIVGPYCEQHGYCKEVNPCREKYKK